MPKSEIDDIFASKGESSLPLASSSVPAKKKKSKKRRREDSDSIGPAPAASASSPTVVPETVVDLSSLPPTPSPKRAKKLKVKSFVPEVVSDNFADSRGKTTRRMTDEGWSIYKEDELNMNKEGGDTALCPFDCNCCF